MRKPALGLKRGLFLLPLLTMLAACTGWDPAKQAEQRSEVNATVARFKAKDPGIERFFRNAYGYAVLPTVGKGAVGVGGAYGKGEVFQQGTPIGRTELIQLTVGFQWGGQAYSEIIFFENKDALERFKAGKLKFSAQASAVAITLGASKTAAYENGVAVFTMTRGGLMYEASIGGQGFTYEAY
jgi:lipid-binding SYLF domain-containing protein